MATRSAIGIKHGDVVKAVYCHWDGYVDYNGKILDQFYRDSVRVNQLISLGNMSSLGADIGEKHDFNQPNDAETLAETRCKFYGRDRGETDAEFRTFQNEQDFVENFDMGEEYFYLYDSGVWYVKAYDGEFEPLHEVLEESESRELSQ